MCIFTKLLFNVASATSAVVRIKISLFLILMIVANVAFADNESLQKFFEDFNASKDKQEHVKTQCDEQILKTKASLKNVTLQERTYRIKVAQIECEYQSLSGVFSSTQGILAALHYAYNEYDKLLNKYYKLYQTEIKKQKNKDLREELLPPGLNINEKVDILLDEQKAWLKLRDSYEAYIMAQHTHVYDINGGGTIYKIDASLARLAFVKKRVDELFYRYLMITRDNGIEFHDMFYCDCGNNGN
ncbi:lysozyme inhibitor LprI family protein [Helicobacter trogontum]|uniref:DUF1311 domain-containing protein n=1 Tax=Helicobacter trogontum TaxID=50960 RepID=A0A4U8TEG0_9HELI|nr:lysozyme inhibitor LprI family protein [Helicobacter trogontum]TLD98431.1 DUF1311 domain-containing protein [Helicobacter trogontum]